MTPEGKVKALVKRALKTHGVYWHCPVQNGMGAPSLDFICCVEGQYVAIETKAPGGKMTPRQQKTAEAICLSGGRVFVVDDGLSLDRMILNLGLTCHAYPVVTHKR